MQKKFCFPKSARLLKSREYHRLSKYGIQKAGSFLTAHILTDHKMHKGAKLGITISKKFGKAHKRNRLKRQIREAFRLQRSALPKNMLIHVRPKSKEISVKTPILEQELMDLTLPKI